MIGNASPDTNENCQVIVCISMNGGDPIIMRRGHMWKKVSRGYSLGGYFFYKHE
ncbi:hypothetical protein [Hallella colorans]|uniref:hypothetical protein n=1 Tax=Hallella colorans TaxID=1703337 RepID=UPI001403EC84|nr:hypothetical protein [Hallella colorans]